jgi:DNA-binding transcriptional MocR family regulator
LLKALAEVPQVDSVSGHAAGLHVVVKLREELPSPVIGARFQRHGIAVDFVSDFQLSLRTDGRLLMAYGHLSEAAIVAGVQRFEAALRR